MRVKVYYRTCPDCGKQWSAQLSQEEVIRIGREIFVCKCGKHWDTGHIEWKNLSRKQQRDYFLSTAEIGVLILCTVIPALFGYFIGDGWHSSYIATLWGLIVGIAFVIVLWLIKLVIIGFSLLRCPQPHKSDFDMQPVNAAEVKEKSYWAP